MSAPIDTEELNENDVPVPVKATDEEVEVKGFQWVFERHFNSYFEFVKAKSEKSVLVRCLVCPAKTLTVTSNSAYNLNIHIESTHKSKLQQFKEATRKRKASELVSREDEEHLEPRSKQLKLDDFQFGRAGAISQVHLDRFVMNYIIENMLPFSTVDSESFKKLVLAARSTNLHVIGRLVALLSKEYEISKNIQIEEYSKIEYFCLTTDLWSSHRRAFLGVTIHWICPETYQRRHNALACRRIKGKHSAYVLASNIDEIVKSYKIPIRKILKIITDGASNFEKAFKDYNLEEDEDEELSEEDMFSFLSEPFDTDGQIFLPPHGRCGSHSICLILTSDIKVKKARTYKKKF